MRILFVSIGGPPKSNAESLQVTKVMAALIAQKNVHITWITDAITPSKTVENEQKSQILLKQINIVELGRSNKILTRIKSKLNPEKQYHHNTSFYLKGLRRHLSSGIIQKNHFDIIYSRSSPVESAILADYLKTQFNLPWIKHMSDPWANSPLFVQNKTRNVIEQNLIDNADFVYLTNKQALKYMLATYDINHKSGVFTNVFDQTYENLSWQDSTSFKIIHTGNFYQSRTPEALLKSISLLSQNIKDNIELHFVGVLNDTALALIDMHNNHVNIINHGAVSYDKAKEIQSKAHLLVSIDPILKPSDAIFLPSKIIDYLAKRIPILALCSPESPSHELMKKGYGVAHNHEDLDNISESIMTFYNQWNQKKSPKLPEIDTYYSANYQAKSLLQEMKKLTLDKT